MRRWHWLAGSSRPQEACHDDRLRPRPEPGALVRQMHAIIGAEDRVGNTSQRQLRHVPMLHETFVCRGTAGAVVLYFQLNKVVPSVLIHANRGPHSSEEGWRRTV